MQARSRYGTADCGGPLCDHGPVSDDVTVRLRVPRTSLLAVFFLLLCVTPLAFAHTVLLVVYVVPLVAALWVLRYGTDVDARGVTVRALLASRRIGWDDIEAIRPMPRGELQLVLRTGGLMRLPAARIRHLDLIAVASGGRVPALDSGDAAAGPAQ